MQNEAAIRIHEITQKFGSNVILNSISLTVDKGEILGLLGPSGSGKTTLVKAVVGMGNIDKGQVTVFGHRMPNLEIVQKIGYMAQADALYEDLNAIEHLAFFGRVYGLTGEEIKEKGKRILELVQLSEHARKKVLYYSGGMKRRLSLAIALFHEPDIIILDEPTVGIDPVLRRHFWDEFLRLRADGKTIIITTHVMDEALHCDRLAMIREGELIAEGRPDQLMQAIHASDIEEVFLHYSNHNERRGRE